MLYGLWRTQTKLLTLLYRSHSLRSKIWWALNAHAQVYRILRFNLVPEWNVLLNNRAEWVYSHTHIRPTLQRQCVWNNRWFWDQGILYNTPAKKPTHCPTGLDVAWLLRLNAEAAQITQWPQTFNLWKYMHSSNAYTHSCPWLNPLSVTGPNMS